MDENALIAQVACWDTQYPAAPRLLKAQHLPPLGALLMHSEQDAMAFSNVEQRKRIAREDILQFKLYTSLAIFYLVSLHFAICVFLYNSLMMG